MLLHILGGAVEWFIVNPVNQFAIGSLSAEHFFECGRCILFSAVTLGFKDSLHVCVIIDRLFNLLTTFKVWKCSKISSIAKG